MDNFSKWFGLVILITYIFEVGYGTEIREINGEQIIHGNYVIPYIEI